MTLWSLFCDVCRVCFRFGGHWCGNTRQSRGNGLTGGWFNVSSGLRVYHINLTRDTRSPIPWFARFSEGFRFLVPVRDAGPHKLSCVISSFLGPENHHYLLRGAYCPFAHQRSGHKFHRCYLVFPSRYIDQAVRLAWQQDTHLVPFFLSVKTLTFSSAINERNFDRLRRLNCVF